MKNLEIEDSQYTPSINMDAVTGVFTLAGNSYPENSFEFYHPVLIWLEQYFQVSTHDKTILNFEIIYFNSSSAKLFYNLFDILDEARDEHDIEVNWIYHKENDSAKEEGEEFIEDFENININLVLKEE